MVRWADYLISAVRYDASGSRIQQVRVHGTTVGPASIWRRAEVARAIVRRGCSFCTIRKSTDGKWRHGADVHVLRLRGELFLRTDGNATEADNLGELPEF